jgi:hypothetical protein
MVHENGPGLPTEHDKQASESPLPWAPPSASDFPGSVTDSKYARIESAINACERQLSELRVELANLKSSSQSARAIQTNSYDSSLIAGPSVGDHRGVLGRRSILVGAGIGAVAAAVGLVIAKPDPAYAANTYTGDILKQFAGFEAGLDSWGHSPPLDSGVTWSRNGLSNVGQTEQILSLINESRDRNNFPWALYIQNSAAGNPNHAVGAYIRHYLQDSPGRQGAWGASFHTDLIHVNSGTSIGCNVELYRTNSRTRLQNAGFDSIASSYYLSGDTLLAQNGSPLSSSSGTAIGVNIQNTVHSNLQGTHAVNIQSTGVNQVWQNGIHFDGPGLGNIGINFDSATYNMGIDLQNNSFRMNAGQKIFLEASGQIFIRYNSGTAKVEIVKSGVVVAQW